MELENSYSNAASSGIFTGLGLCFRLIAQRYLLPFTAVLGRYRLPVLGMFLGLGSRFYLTSTAAAAIPANVSLPQKPSLAEGVATDLLDASAQPPAIRPVEERHPAPSIDCGPWLSAPEKPFSRLVSVACGVADHGCPSAVF